MLKLLKMDFYRMFRTKSLYVITAIYVALNLFSMWLTTVLMADQDAKKVGSEAYNALPHSFNDFAGDFFFGTTIVLFVVIFAVIFSNGDFKKGFIKNIVSATGNRSSIMISKLIAMSFLVILLNVISGVMILIANAAYFHFPLDLSLLSLLKAVAVEILASVAVTSFILTVFYITGKNVISTIIAIVYVNSGAAILGLVNTLLSKTVGLKHFDITEFTALGNLSKHLGLASSGTTLLRIAVVSIVVIVLTCMISVTTLNKKDL